MRRDEIPFERLIADMSGRFLQSGPDAIDAEIERALAALGAALIVDRCFTFLVSAGGSGHRVRHVWTAPGIAPDRKVIGQVMQDVFPWVGAKMLRYEDIVVNCLDELPSEATLELAYCQGRGVRSFLMCPMHAGRTETMMTTDISTKKRAGDARVLIALVFALFASQNLVAGSTSEKSMPLSEDLKATSADLPPGALEHADGTQASTKSDSAASAQCAAFEADPRADVGDIIRAGCKPTTAQMSKLMDNPLGNVAMLFTQFDLYKLENPENGEKDEKFNYMGIAQFPKGIGENWNLINRIVWNVPSMPLDQGKIDRAKDEASELSSLQGATLPPAGSPIAPIDLFSGRTTGFGDMYYVGLFSPKEGIKHKNGATSVWGLGFELMFPTASEEILGTGKWGAGPSAIYAYLGKKWKGSIHRAENIAR